ncbi:unnamed protein product [Ascophyllum nodosum]
MVRRLVLYFNMASVLARCAAGLSVTSSRPAFVVSAMDKTTMLPSPQRADAGSTSRPIARTLPTIAGSFTSSRLKRIRTRLGMTAGATTSATSAPFTSSAMPTTIARPAGAAKLNRIDFNPDVRVSGPGASTPVVIMHGLLGNSRNFQGWGAKLVKSLDKERRVFAVDMRNHGASSHHDTMTYVDMADDVLGFMADEGLSEAVLVGHSMGGKTAAMTALLHPSAVKGLIVMDIAPVSYSTESGLDLFPPSVFFFFFFSKKRVDATNWGETQKIIEALHGMRLDDLASRRDADERLSKDVVDPAHRAFAVTNLGKDSATGRWQWRINIDAIQRSKGELARFNSEGRSIGGGESGLQRLAGGRGGDSGREELPQYTGDTLFIAGGNSRYVRSKHLPEIRKLFPTFVVSTIKGAGHWVHADNPEETLRLAKSFLDRPELP